jgi:sugar lactone lactonase YvrE
MNHTTALPNLVNSHSIQRLGTQTDILGECPLWDTVAQCLYWVDIRRPAIRRLTHATGEIQTWTMPELVGSIALVEDGRLLVAMPTQIALFDPVNGELSAWVPSTDSMTVDVMPRVVFGLAACTTSPVHPRELFFVLKDQDP